MSGYKNARGMPSVELSDRTKEAIAIQEEQEVIENTKIPEKEMFKKPNLDIKGVVDKAMPVKKPKKKLTERQLEALARGREKSKQTRAKKKAEKEAEKKAYEEHRQAVKKPLSPVKEQAEERLPNVKFNVREKRIIDDETEEVLPQERPVNPPVAQPPQLAFDYDRVIQGVIGHLDNRPPVHSTPPVAPPPIDYSEFEQNIRLNERQRVLDDIDRLQREEEREYQRQQSQKVLTTPPTSTQPYSYGSYKNYGAGRARSQFGHRY